MDIASFILCALLVGLIAVGLFKDRKYFQEARNKKCPVKGCKKKSSKK